MMEKWLELWLLWGEDARLAHRVRTRTGQLPISPQESKRAF